VPSPVAPSHSRLVVARPLSLSPGPGHPLRHALAWSIGGTGHLGPQRLRAGYRAGYSYGPLPIAVR
jgi:hypothetical protein